MTHSKASEQPVGYWLKAADHALTASIDAAQRELGVTRLGWQVLNTIQRATNATADEIAATLHMFTARTTLDVLLAALRARGWIQDDAGPVRLTDEGQRAHARILERQQEIRRRATAGISQADYDTTLRVLQCLVANLGDAGEERTSGGTRTERQNGRGSEPL